MKKIISVLSLLLILSLLLSAGAFAERPDSITFREIPWYSTAPDVDKTIKGIDGVSTPWLMATSTDTKIDSWYRIYDLFYTDDAVEAGGDIYRYENVPVAGYTADLKTTFLYPVIDGVVTHDSKLAEFYMATYTIEDLEDMMAVYEDLKGKLESVYGTSSDKSYYNSFENTNDPEGCVFEAEDGSLIWLAARYNTYSEKYDTVEITYFAPDGNRRLAELAAAIRQNVLDAETAERESNAGNTSGL